MSPKFRRQFSDRCVYFWVLPLFLFEVAGTSHEFHGKLTSDDGDVRDEKLVLVPQSCHMSGIIITIDVPIFLFIYILIIRNLQLYK